ncbi:MAG: hypothetical protein VZT48_12015 [Bulleidia sp.]|nr:hypothetical protein [Bulleidia sp.]
MKNVIVIIGYDRPASIRRCYEAVNNAMYPEEDQIDLIFSLDHSGQEESIVPVLENLPWIHGDKKVITHAERMGLRAHVISCGRLIENGYDCLIMLEDDIVVSNSFYYYVRQAALIYDKYPEVQGISLYRDPLYKWNGRIFTPEYTGSDVFFMQAAQSWGQAWTRRMWDGFHAWYQANPAFEQNLAMPDHIYSWDQRSWLRYFEGWVCSNDAYCLVYPYHSLSTNMEELGENRKTRDTDYTMDLINGQKEFRMPEPGTCVHYDCHFERKNDAYFEYSYQGQPVLMDLNGSYTKYADYRYVCSTRIIDYEVIKSYGLILRPQELNVSHAIPGDIIFLYDMKKPKKNTHLRVNPDLVRYDVRAQSWKRLIYLGLHEWKNGGK